MPVSEGADVIGDIIIRPLHGSWFNVMTGELIDWCPLPPIISPVTDLVVKRKNLVIFDVRNNSLGSNIEILVDMNAKKTWEADHWKERLGRGGTT